MRGFPGLFIGLILFLAAPATNNSAAQQNAGPVQRIPAALFIPGRIALHSASELVVRMKGLESPGRSLFTSPCQIRYTVFTRDGKGVFMYPKTGTICPDVAYGFSTRRGKWEQFALDLRWAKRANLPSGKYWIIASIVASEKMGGVVRLPAFVSNTARLEIP
jgi:hypothetical protein